LQIEPYFSTYSNLGTAYFFMKQYPNAVGMFEKAVALNPNDTVMVVNLADAYRYSGQQDKARATYQQAISVGFKGLQTNPKDAEIMAQLALSYAKTGNVAQAQEFIKRARDADPSNVNYIYDDAEILTLSGKTAEALKSLQEGFEKHYPAEFASGDPELSTLQKDPRFIALIKKYSTKSP
ncbi:MAG: tetratricopeptide repeat protein, partial [Candidatus Acidiferrales bacterium]